MYRPAAFHLIAPVWRLQPLLLLLLTLGLSICTGRADTRLDREESFADRTYQAMSFQPFEWRPHATQVAGGTLGDLFSRGGIVGNFAAGFLGAGVIGLLFGHGVVGELTGLVSILGLACQLALIVLLGRVIWRWWYYDRTDAAASLSPRQLADAYGHSRHEGPSSFDAGARTEPRDDGLGHPK